MVYIISVCDKFNKIKKVSCMEFERKLLKLGDSTGLVLPPDLIKYMELKVEDIIVIKDDIGKHGKFVAFWKKNR